MTLIITGTPLFLNCSCAAVLRLAALQTVPGGGGVPDDNIWVQTRTAVRLLVLFFRVLFRFVEGEQNLFILSTNKKHKFPFVVIFLLILSQRNDNTLPLPMGCTMTRCHIQLCHVILPYLRGIVTVYCLLSVGADQPGSPDPWLCGLPRKPHGPPQ